MNETPGYRLSSVPHGARRGLRSRLVRLCERWLGLPRLEAAYERALARLGPSQRPFGVDEFLTACIAELQVRCDLPTADLDRVPESGPLLVVANHPHGILDGLLLAHLLRRVRKDVRILGNRWLARIPELADLVLDVDVTGAGLARRSNAIPMRHAMRWLQGGGTLLVFPAGKVSARTLRRSDAHDDVWSPSIARLQQRTRAQVLPVHIGGGNSALFQAVGLVHPRLRTLLLFRETWRKRGATIPVRIGNAIPDGQLARFQEDGELVAYLRLRTEILGRRPVSGGTVRVLPPPRREEPIVPAVDPASLARDVAALHPTQRLAVGGELEVWHAFAPQVPHVLREIGRLRERTFRAVGEGTGRPIDLDAFDPHYLHLFVWHPGRRAVVGAYRLGRVDHLLVGNDQRALYTNTLYDFDQRFLAHVSPGLELGRSFVVDEWQREFLPLLMLWRGIGAFVARHPQCHVLFGAVSISDRHHDVSKQLMLDHLRHHMDPVLTALVTPRNPVPVATGARTVPLQWTDAMIADLGHVSAMVAEIETEARGVPVLLREYLKLGGRLAGVNVDPTFGNSITALVVVDLRRTDPRLLGRYMGRAEAAAFLDWHEACDRRGMLESA